MTPPLPALQRAIAAAVRSACADVLAVALDDGCAADPLDDHRLDGLAGPVCSACAARLRLEETLARCARCSAPVADPGVRECLACTGARRRPVALESPRAHSGTARALVHALKYAGRTDVAELLAREALRDARVAAAIARADVLVPAPSEPLRRRERGHDPAELLALALASHVRDAEGRAPRVRRALVLRRGAGRQVGRPAAQRRVALRGNVVARPLARLSVRGRRVVVVDDVVTTGATIAESSRVLRRLGAAAVEAVSMTRAQGALVPEPSR